jgi:hypothetical protein
MSAKVIENQLKPVEKVGFEISPYFTNEERIVTTIISEEVIKHTET